MIGRARRRRRLATSWSFHRSRKNATIHYARVLPDLEGEKDTDGYPDGPSVGSLEGRSEGAELGILEGESVGSNEGTSEGDSLGSLEGNSEGDRLGTEEGNSEGSNEGTGDNDGASDLLDLVVCPRNLFTMKPPPCSFLLSSRCCCNCSFFILAAYIKWEEEEIKIYVQCRTEEAG